MDEQQGIIAKRVQERLIKELPHGFELRSVVTRGSMWVQLLGPDGTDMVYCDSELTLGEMQAAALSDAIAIENGEG